MASQTELPFPWELRWSRTKSRFYYYNPETKISQWKKPCGSKKQSGTRILPENIVSSTGKLTVRKNSVKNENIVKVPENGKGKDSSKFSKESQPYGKNSVIKTELLVPRILQVSTSRQPTENVVPASKKSVAAGSFQDSSIRAKASEAEVVETLKPKSKNQRKRANRARKNAVEEKLNEAQRLMSSRADDFSKRVDTGFQPADDRLLRWQATSGRIVQEEEEEDMEVEYSTEVQLIFQEIQGVREEMRKSENMVITESRTMVDSLTSTSDLTSPHLNQKLWMVLDTNLFLEDGKFLVKLKEDLLRRSRDFVFVIPWVVIQELDHIKDSNRSETNAMPFSLKSRARSAINMINKWLEQKDPSVVGQNPREAVSTYETRNGFTIENNDDKILHCCLQYQDKYFNSQLVLLTLDKNLRNKAMVLGINTYSKETLSKWLKVSSPVKDHMTYQPASSSLSNSSFNPLRGSVELRAGRDRQLPKTSPSCFPPVAATPKGFSTPIGVRPLMDSLLTPVRATGSSNVLAPTVAAESSSRLSSFLKPVKSSPLNDLTASLELEMLESLSSVLELAMKDAYKDLWEEILNKQKPWSLQDIMSSIDRLWIAVFATFWNRCDRELLKELTFKFSSKPCEPSELFSRLEKCKRLWRAFDYEKWNRDSSCLTEYKHIKKKILEKLSQLEDSLKKAVTDSETAIADNKTTIAKRTVTDNKNQPLELTGPCPDAVCDTSTVAIATSQSSSSASSTFPSSMVEEVCPMDSEDDLQKVCSCFDVVLKNMITFRDIFREQLSTSFNLPNRQSVIESYLQLCRCVCTIHDQYQRALLESENSNNSADCCSLAMILSSFCQEYNIKGVSISWQTMKNFFNDVARREVVEVGFSQIQTLRTSILECCQLLTAAEAQPFFS